MPTMARGRIAPTASHLPMTGRSIAPPSVPDHSARVGPVALVLARKLGLTPGSAHQVLHGQLAHRAGAVIESFAEVRRFEELAAWDVPIRAAYDAVQALPLTGEMIVTAQDADLSEDQAESRYHQHPCRETAQVWVRAILREMARQQQAATALAARWDLTL